MAGCPASPRNQRTSDGRFCKGVVGLFIGERGAGEAEVDFYTGLRHPNFLTMHDGNAENTIGFHMVHDEKKYDRIARPNNGRTKF
jgi:hypothetical protein